MSRRRGRPRRAGGGGRQPPAAGDAGWSLRFGRNVVLWLLPVAAVWILATPFYNRFLTHGAENLVRLTESPAVTRLQAHQRHHFLITRTDFPSSRGALSSVRVTETHCPLILLGALFLAVPGLRWRSRLEPLGWAVLAAVFFHLVSLLCQVKFVYATQMGGWSAEHYGPLAQNFWGMAKHLLDLPFKFAFPLLLWAAFHLRLLLPGRAGSGPPSAAAGRHDGR